MPRPKKPTYYPPEFKIKKIRLDTAIQKQLVKCLGIDKDQARINAMAADIEEALTMHQIWVEELNKTPSIGSKITSLQALHKITLKLFNEIRKLDVYTKRTLYSHVSFRGLRNRMPIDPEAAYLSDIDAINQVMGRLDNAIESLMLHKKQGTRKDAALRITVFSLAMLFEQHKNQGKRLRESNLERFISEALSSIEICTKPLNFLKPDKDGKLNF